MTASLTLDQWRKVQDISNVSMDPYIPEDDFEMWRKPIADLIKINTDAAMFDETGYYGFDFVVRASDENLVMARTCCMAL